MAFVDRFPHARRVSLAVLLLALAALYFGLVEPHRIKKHTVTFHITGPIEEVTRIDTNWTCAEPPDSDITSGTSLFFAPGTAPREVRATVQLPSGSFWLDVAVSRGSKQSTTRQLVSLDGDTTVFVPSVEP